MEREKREELMKRRQRLLDLLNLCHWDLYFENYKDASFEVDEIKKIMDAIIKDLNVHTL